MSTRSSQIILASQSPYRRAQLEQIGIAFQTAIPKIDEEELKTQGPEDLTELTRYLAFYKAQSLQAEFPQAILIGSDQIAECDGERLDKPGDESRAHLQLSKLQGRMHRLLTSVSVIAPALTQTFTNVSEIELYPLSPDEISAYLKKDRPFDCAGSYKIEKAGMFLIRKIKTEDASSIQGLPMLSVCHALRKLGVKL
jgi:septum formation protein